MQEWSLKNSLPSVVHVTVLLLHSISLFSLNVLRIPLTFISASHTTRSAATSISFFFIFKSVSQFIDSSSPTFHIYVGACAEFFVVRKQVFRSTSTNVSCWESRGSLFLAYVVIRISKNSLRYCNKIVGMLLALVFPRVSTIPHRRDLSSLV